MEFMEAIMTEEKPLLTRNDVEAELVNRQKALENKRKLLQALELRSSNFPSSDLPPALIVDIDEVSRSIMLLEEDIAKLKGILEDEVGNDRITGRKDTLLFTPEWSVLRS